MSSKPSILTSRHFFSSVIIAYSPIHVLSSCQLGLNCKSTLLILPASLYEHLSEYFDLKFSVIFLEMPVINSHPFQKILYLFFALLKPLYLACNAIYLPSASHPVVKAIASKVSFRYLYYIDEGNTHLSMLRHINLGASQNSNRIARRFLSFLGISVGLHILDDNFSRLYVYNHVLLSKLISHSAIYPIPSTLELPLKKDYLDSEILCNFSSENLPLIVYIGSPITENGWSNYKDEEVQLLQKFLLANEKSSSFKLIIKPHYRERIHKYQSILDNYNSFVASGQLPFQCITPYISVKCLIGFHSSALLSYFPIQPPIYSLTSNINTREMKCLHESMMQLQPFYPGLNFPSIESN